MYLSRLRSRVEARTGERCQYCQAPQSACGYRFRLEHIVAIAQGGHDDESNLALACASCNLAKSDRVSANDPVSGDEAPLFHPRTQPWREHFQWTENYRMLKGLTATGRATVLCLNLNGELRAAALSFWFEDGLLPP